MRMCYGGVPNQLDRANKVSATATALKALR